MHRKGNMNPFRSQIVDYLCRYDEIEAIGGELALKILGAIDDTLESLQGQEDGAIIIKLITMIYINQTHNTTGAAMVCNIDRATAFRWINRFIYDVCIRSELLDRKKSGNVYKI